MDYGNSVCPWVCVGVFFLRADMCMFSFVVECLCSSYGNMWICLNVYMRK